MSDSPITPPTLTAVEMANALEINHNAWHRELWQAIDYNANRIPSIENLWTTIREQVQIQLALHNTHRTIEPTADSVSIQTPEPPLRRLNSAHIRFHEASGSYRELPYDFEQIHHTIQGRIRHVLDVNKSAEATNAIYTMIRHDLLYGLGKINLPANGNVQPNMHAWPHFVPVVPEATIPPEHLQSIHEQLVIVTYGHIAQDNQYHVRVPIHAADIQIMDSKNELPYSTSVEQNVRHWSRGMAPCVYKQSAEFPWLYAVHNERIIGFIAGDTRGNIGGIVVSPNYRRYGIANRLLTKFTTIMPDSVRTLRADAVISSLPFWQAQSFTVNRINTSMHGNCKTISKTIR